MDNSNANHSTTGSRHSFIAGYAAIFIVTILIVLKSYAYHQSDALSILSSLIDSVLDSIVSIMALASIYYASRPADSDHRWGHGKMEAVSALFQSAVIVAGAAFLIFESFDRFFKPEAIVNQMMGVYVMVISIVLSIILVTIQRYSLSQNPSLAVEADSVHYGSDILINAGVLCVLILTSYGAPFWIDAFFAIAVAVFMVVLASKIAFKSLDVLLDREVSEEDRQKIIEIIEAHEGVDGWHDLRTRLNGKDYIISFDFEADPEMSLWAAHEIAKDLEKEILELYPNSEIMIHIDPTGYTDDARHRVKGVHI